MGPGEHERRFRPPVRAVAVVRAKVSGVGGGLVDVGPRGDRLALDLQHEHATAEQQHDVGATLFQGQFVLEDGRVVRRVPVGGEDLADLVLERRDAVVPRVDLLDRGAAEERLEGAADRDRRRVAELGKRR